MLWLSLVHNIIYAFFQNEMRIEHYTIYKDPMGPVFNYRERATKCENCGSTTVYTPNWRQGKTFRDPPI